MQLTLFESPPVSQEEIKICIDSTKKELSNVRRGLFRRYGELEEEISQLKRELAEIRDILGIVTKKKFSLPLFES